MGALLRTELLLELLSRITVELVMVAGWHGAAICVLVTVLTRGVRQEPIRENHVCVATVLLVLLLADPG
ncbi:hypothetical protein [Streptomyces oceani]|uniref:Uncharacterized protein n=1 Tax=Streptomyces oceani TaxID=1075402 RepID=A0A1E7KQ54_9ACTN|nr:hypothetical protein [Streptomyces oceani]OEV06024.1 hypothetical protein AN216_00685 [Streptomyces oceani]